MEIKNESAYESNNDYFKNWNEGLKDGRLHYHEPVNYYKKFSSFDYSKYVKIEDPLKITEEKIKDLETGKVDEILVTVSGSFYGVFQILDNEERIIDLDPEKLNFDFDYFDSFFGGSFKEDKNVFMGDLYIIQHQEVSVQWFLEVLKQKQLDEESGEWDDDDHSITGGGYGGFLNWSYEMVAFADETGLNVDGVISDEEMGLLRHGVSLSYQNLSGAKNTFDIAAAAANGEFVGGDIEDEVYFKYK